MNSIYPRVLDALSDCSVPAFMLAWRTCTDQPTLPSTYITCQETLRKEELSADGEPIILGRYVQVDIWSEEYPTLIIPQVRAGMKSDGFISQGEQDFYETDTEMYRISTQWVYFEENEME